MAAMDTGETVLSLTIGLVDDTALRPASVVWVDQGHRDSLLKPAPIGLTGRGDDPPGRPVPRDLKVN
jgi:hypothetical protein